MLSTPFTMSIGGDKELSRSFEGIDGVLGDLRPAFKGIADLFTKNVKAEFDTEGGRSGNKWRALSPAYAARKGAGMPILVVTGRMRQSFRKGGPGHVRDIQKLSMKVGSTNQIALYHQSRKPRTKLPRRPMVVLTENDKRAYMRYLQNNLIDSVNKVWRTKGAWAGASFGRS